MKTPAPDRRLIVKELEDRLKKKWAAQKSDTPEPSNKKHGIAPLKKGTASNLHSGLSNPLT